MTMYWMNGSVDKKICSPVKHGDLLDFVDAFKQKLIRSGVLPENYDFESHKKRNLEEL